jgi:D-alanyl-lipoteichoic acid acyltransferase DltB (MBOAT superfamily)
LLVSSSTYFVFLVAVFFLYWPVSRWRALGLAVLLFANYFFYAKWDLRYLALIPAASTIDYLLALGIGKASRQWLRRLLVSMSVALNVGLLIWVRPLFPVGISFYAFQALSYTIDVYRRDAKPTSSYLGYLTAVSFFATQLSGPITRAASLVEQFDKTRKKLEAAEGGRGLFLIGLGLIKKLMIADFIGSNLVNRVFDFPNLYTGAEVIISVYAYALQLYYDFSGYTDIVIGSALLLGLKLPANFNRPYAAQNIADFWRRWHISLSNWLRDYLYFSLPGKRTKIMPYLGLLITMALGGLWHGMSWNFLIWGLLHGAGLAIVRLWQTWRKGSKTAAWHRYVAIFFTVQYVCFAWIFFRAPDLNKAGEILSRIGSGTISFANVSTPLWIVLAIAILAHYLPKKSYDFGMNLYVRAPFYAQAAALALLVIGLQFVAQTGAAPFIYTKF